MGAPGWEGNNCHKWHSEDELKKMLREEFKKNGIKATVRSRDAGYLTAINVTIKLDKEDIRTVQGYKRIYTPENVKEVPLQQEIITTKYSTYRYVIPIGHLWYHSDEFTDKERAEMLDYGAKQAYTWNIERVSNGQYDYPVSPKGKINILTEKGNNKYQKVSKIVRSYDYEKGNSMVDYFDHGIYANIYFKYKFE